MITKIRINEISLRKTFAEEEYKITKALIKEKMKIKKIRKLYIFYFYKYKINLIKIIEKG